MLFPTFDKMNACGITTIVTSLALLIVASTALFFVQVTGAKQLASGSSRQCPPSILTYDMYFCAGADFTNFSAANNQGLTDGFITTIGPLGKFNIGYDLWINYIP